MYTNINIDIDVENIYEELSDSDKYLLLDWLTDDGITNMSTETSQISYMREEWDEICSKLSQLHYRMTNEEQAEIEKIVKKYL
jgi:hypothetical protein